MSVPRPEAPWQATVLTLFPGMFPGPLGASLAGRALLEGRWSLDTIDMRDFAADAHRTVDDTPFGGGRGMVLRPDIVAAAIAAARATAVERPLVCLSARGRLLDQEAVRRLSSGPGVILVCGRFEGIDQRALEASGADEVAIGDYVLSGGEPAAFVVLDACVRLLPGVVGAPESLAEESHADGLLEYPQYTRPQEWCGRRVPEVLLSGHHGRIRAWRLAAAEETTRARRPDLWARYLERRRATPGDA